jgi:hypothetical protein
VRTAIFVTIIIGAAINPCWGQQASKAPAPKRSAAELLARLSSHDAGERAQAYEQLRSVPGALNSAKVRAALLDLLDRENRTTASDIGSAGESTDVGEGYAEYVSALLGSVDSIADWKDAHQLCILAHAPYNPDSAFAAKLASAGQPIVPCLMQMAASDLSVYRYQAVPVLIQLHARVPGLAPATVGNIAEIATHALHDPDEMVRIGTVQAMDSFGTEDMIPALKEVADSDPSYAKSEDKLQVPGVRENAVKAIVAIQKRASQH